MAKGENSGEGDRSADSICSGMRGVLRILMLLWFALVRTRVKSRYGGLRRVEQDLDDTVAQANKEDLFLLGRQ